MWLMEGYVAKLSFLSHFYIDDEKRYSINSSLIFSLLHLIKAKTIIKTSDESGNNNIF